MIVAKPPHLQNEQDLKKLPKITELYIDTGYSKEYLEEIVEVGTPIGFRTYNTSLVSGRYVGKSFDDKSCVAAAVEAVRKTKREDMEYDVYLLLSAQEESARKGGAMVAAYGIYPDVAIVLDVNLASFPGVNEYETVKLGKGPSVSLSAVTDRKLTNKIIDTAKKNIIDCQSIVEISSTGTNADLMGLTGNGIPVAVVSIPLRNMHTQSEIIDLEDVKNTVKLLQAIITEKECEN